MFKDTDFAGTFAYCSSNLTIIPSWYGQLKAQSGGTSLVSMLYGNCDSLPGRMKKGEGDVLSGVTLFAIIAVTKNVIGFLQGPLTTITPNSVYQKSPDITIRS